MNKLVPIESLYEHIAFLAKENQNRTALIRCGIRGEILEEISYSTLLKYIKSIASFLHSLGLREKDRVALAFANSPDKFGYFL